jgi:hypothetical protein
MITETEHWIFQLIPRYVRRPYTKVYKKVTCNFCNGESSTKQSPFSIDWHDRDCDWCFNTGEIEKEIPPVVPPAPTIPQSYIDHMKKAHKEYMDGKMHRPENIDPPFTGEGI